MAKKAENPIHLPKVLLVAVDAPYNRIPDINAYIKEFEKLAKTNNLVADKVISIKLREIEPGTFFTKGKLQELQELCEKEKYDEVVISEPLTSQQEHNLRALLHTKVFDRTQLILEIFEKAALSAEGKMQVEIAMLKHQKSRVAGKGIHMSQQGGGGFYNKGAGETAKEKELRYFEDQILKIKQHLEKLRKVRSTQRKQRLQSATPLICLVGYTNAGKSTILNTLTKSNVLAADKLFLTLDTTTRELFIDGKKTSLISDTVGFIQLLPPNLIEAFKSTLEELEYADLLLQVVDISDKNWEAHIKVVNEILNDLKIKKEMLYVFNKIDQTDAETISGKIPLYKPHVVISANSKDGINPLIEFIKNWKINLENATKP